MFNVRGLATNCKWKETEQWSTPETLKNLISICGRGNLLICPANYLAHTGDVEQVQHYASVDASKHLEPGVAGDPFVVWTGL